MIRSDSRYSNQELRWKTYTIEVALPTTRRVELVGKKVFGAAALDPEHETYVVHVVSLDSTPFDADVHPSRRPQISGLIAEEASTKVPDEYADFADVFSHTGINKHAIELVDTNGFIKPFRSPAGAPILFEGQFR